MARKKVRSYFEPWVTTKSVLHGKNPFPDGIPKEGYPEGAAESIMDAWARIDRDAGWIIWGSHMASPAACKNLDGTISVTDDRRIITVSRKLGLPDGAPSHEDLSKRIASCVNACAGIADPEKFIADARALLLGYVSGDCVDPRDDPKAVSLLGRCIPLEELEKCRHETEVED